MADGGTVSRRRGVRFSAAVARRICARVASGESMLSISRDADMPSRSTMTKWARVLPKFRASLRRAQALGGWTGVGSAHGGQPAQGYCEVTAKEIFARLCEGEALTAICADPWMPGTSSVYRWRERVPEFAKMMALARQVQAEQLCDEGLEVARAVTPADAYATHVKLTHLRWTAISLSPRRFARTKAVDPEAVEAAMGAPAAEERRIFFRHFRVEERKSDGACRVVSFRPDPETGQLIRETPEDAPWKPVPPSLAARWRSPADSARACGVVGVNAPPPLRDGDSDPDAETWGRG